MVESSYLTLLVVITKFQLSKLPPYVLSGTSETQIFIQVEEADARSIGAISAILRAAKYSSANGIGGQIIELKSYYPLLVFLLCCSPLTMLDTHAALQKQPYDQGAHLHHTVNSCRTFFQ